MSYQYQPHQKPRNLSDEAIVEIRAGAGGDEAALFAAELFNLYKKYAASKAGVWTSSIPTKTTSADTSPSFLRSKGQTHIPR
jgi:protein subunit release factor A